MRRASIIMTLPDDLRTERAILRRWTAPDRATRDGANRDDSQCRRRLRPSAAFRRAPAAKARALPMPPRFINDVSVVARDEPGGPVTVLETGDPGVIAVAKSLLDSAGIR